MVPPLASHKMSRWVWRHRTYAAYPSKMELCWNSTCLKCTKGYIDIKWFHNLRLSLFTLTRLWPRLCSIKSWYIILNVLRWIVHLLQCLYDGIMSMLSVRLMFPPINKVYRSAFICVCFWINRANLKYIMTELFCLLDKRQSKCLGDFARLEVLFF